ncbi:peptidase family M28 [Plectosphaerella plurivora]|uniref:Peptide hydrolase n=1 Tax=Plectosphaerella plurivora TaxID=936078 RepID=A0A9P9AAR5_9PEZI|nr:peptidase family M28 [Plectosphaerella plurivora]
MVLLTALLAVASALIAPTNAYAKLPDDALRAIPSGGDDFDINSGSLLAPILIPRVPGTPGSAKARNHFVDFFREHLPAWSVEWHNSTSKTPATGDKDIPFSNLIFRRDPPWAKDGDVSRLTLVAHYDTLYQPDGFIGAIDSAAPCAMLLQVAKNLEGGLVKKWEHMQAQGEASDGVGQDTGVQIILLDGEEAWVKWTDEDSLYGSRALAETWESTIHPSTSAFRTPLASISLFLLVDLLGAKNPSVPSFFTTTHWAYRHMAKVEKRLRAIGALETTPRRPFLRDGDKPRSEFTSGYVGDDHVPFLQRGVEILHVIPTPFPPQWHKMTDDGDHLDLPTLRDWARIVSGFAAEWMELGEHLPRKTDAEMQKEKARAVHSDEL